MNFQRCSLGNWASKSGNQNGRQAKGTKEIKAKSKKQKAMISRLSAITRQA